MPINFKITINLLDVGLKMCFIMFFFHSEGVLNAFGSERVQLRAQGVAPAQNS